MKSWSTSLGLTVHTWQGNNWEKFLTHTLITAGDKASLFRPPHVSLFLQQIPLIYSLYFVTNIYIGPNRYLSVLGTSIHVLMNTSTIRLYLLVGNISGFHDWFLIKATARFYVKIIKDSPLTSCKATSSPIKQSLIKHIEVLIHSFIVCYCISLNTVTAINCSIRISPWVDLRFLETSEHLELPLGKLR